VSNIEQQSIELFLEALASKSATPGGGSSAALMGAQGAALVSMVCRLTIGKPQFAEFEQELQTVLTQAENLRAELTRLIQADIDVFNRLMSKYALPKATEDEKTARSQTIQDVLKTAIDVPMQCIIACVEIIKLSKVAAEKGNPGVVSDAGAGVMAAYGALKASALNVHINAASLKDKKFADSKLAELKSLTDGIEQQVDAIYQIVKARL
jgi:formiminotetrahydrofolate cyclodeaminase